MTESSPEDIALAYEDALDDVHTRFLLNLPPEELATADRIFFQLEQAWWFYDDFICDNSKLPLPRFKSLKPFALKMFQISPMLPLKNFDKMWEEFSAYKRNISNYGTILINADATKMILCKLWQSNTWTFPAGKVNQNERGIDAGARETYEETGFDPSCSLGLTKKMLEDGEDLSWKPLQEEDSLVVMDAGKRRTMYVCRGVPDGFPFAPVARKEVSAVEWHSIDDVPKKSFAVLPFMKQLRRWIKNDKKKTKQSTPGGKGANSAKKGRSANNSRGRDSGGRDSRGRDSRGRDSRGRDSRGRVREDDPLTESGLARAGEFSGWSEDDMFDANEKLIGRKVEYDGNPHYFSDKGFDGRDPHAFRVVGGTFMNSGGVASLAPPPDHSKLQPLFRKQSDSSNELQPFFSESGVTPWGELVLPAAGTVPAKCNASGVLEKGLSREEDDKKDGTVSQILLASDDMDVAFLTDAEVTARSQMLKVVSGQSPSHVAEVQRARSRKKHKENILFIHQWLRNLSQTADSKEGSGFHFNIDEIMEAASVAMV